MLSYPPSMGRAPCLVCEAPALHEHFGARCCRACAAFFRRSVARSLSYKCQRHGKCEVSSSKYSCLERFPRKSMHMPVVSFGEMLRCQYGSETCVSSVVGNANSCSGAESGRSCGPRRVCVDHRKGRQTQCETRVQTLGQVLHRYQTAYTSLKQLRHSLYRPHDEIFRLADEVSKRSD